MNVVAYDPYPDKEAAAELGYDYVDLDELVREANIISLNCPLTDSHTIYCQNKNLRRWMEDDNQYCCQEKLSTPPV